MSTRKIMTALAAVKAVKDYLSELDRALKADLMEQLGGRMSAAAAVLPDGSEAATVTISRGRAARWVVVDEAAFLSWVKANRPTAIVQTVRSSDTESILTSITATGEVPDGVMEGEPGEPYVMVRQSPAQRAATVAAWQTGQLPLPTMDQMVASLLPATPEIPPSPNHPTVDLPAYLEGPRVPTTYRAGEQ